MSLLMGQHASKFTWDLVVLKRFWGCGVGAGAEIQKANSKRNPYKSQKIERR